MFRDREEAGQRLAQALSRFAGRPDVLVLALPRGGVPVGVEVARALEAPFDLMLVRKLGVPGHEELAMGAIASGGGRVLNQRVIELARLTEQDIEQATTREQAELRRREKAYREGRPHPRVEGRCVILVDDGLATGSTMLAAVRAVRQGNPASVVVAVPVAPPESCEGLRAEADDVICVETPARFMGVGQLYENF
ncbi:MAG: phosphoribosyltransferase family protein, partial [Phycisphaeraceae bacterium]